MFTSFWIAGRIYCALFSVMHKHMHVCSPFQSVYMICSYLKNGMIHICVLISFTTFVAWQQSLSPWRTRWRHQMKTSSALLALCAGNSPVTGEFSSQRPVTRGFDAFFDLRLNKRLSKQSRGWWFETPSRLLLRHCNENRDRQYHYNGVTWA